MDRYSIIRSGTQREWIPGCPIRIESYNILFDNVDGANKLQVKYKNIYDKVIKGAWVDVEGFDDAGDGTEHQPEVAYININVRSGDFFGADRVTALSSISTVNVKLIPVKVAFEDGSVWRNDSRFFGINIRNIDAGEAYGDLYDQYAAELSKLNLPARYAFADMGEYWLCPCGQPNERTAEACCNCGTGYSDLERISDKAYLSQLRLREQEVAERAKRLKEEAEQRRAQEAEERRKQAAEAALKKERNRKAMIRKLLLIAAAGILVLGVYNGSKLVKYGRAVSMVNNREYEAAIQAFTDLGEFLNAPDKKNEAYYLYGESLIEAGDTASLMTAVNAFTAIGDYEDSPTKLQECNYNIATIEFNNGVYRNAVKFYTEAGDYSDSKDKLTVAAYNAGVAAYNSGDFESAVEYYGKCTGYSNAATMLASAKNQVTLAKAADNYNKGYYEAALLNAASIPYVNSAKPGVAGANEIAQWSKEKLFAKATSGLETYEDSISMLETLDRYQYQPAIDRLRNIRNKFNAISGTYDEDGGGRSGYKWDIDADYRTNKIDATLYMYYSSLGYRDEVNSYSGELISTGGTYGSFKLNSYNSSALYFYKGYLIHDNGYSMDRYTK